MKYLKLFAVLAALILTGNVFAGSMQHINPSENKCNVLMPPDNSPRFYSTSGNKIKYTRLDDRHWMVATCVMTDFEDGGNLPTTAVPFTADDFDSPRACMFKDPDNGIGETTTYDYQITVTPAGKIKLTCFFELNGS